MKTYVLILSKTFPKTHKRAGELTLFDLQIKSVAKLHTIRSNFPLWKKRILEVKKGNAIISIRQWSGKPYRSKQVVIGTLNNESGIDFQQIKFFNGNIFHPIVNGKEIMLMRLAKHDGLSLDCFHDWFKGYDLTKTMIIIQFTPFKY